MRFYSIGKRRCLSWLALAILRQRLSHLEQRRGVRPMGGLITFLLFIVAGCAGDVNPGAFFMRRGCALLPTLRPRPVGMVGWRKG